MLWIILLVVIITGVAASIRLARERNNEFDELVDAPMLPPPTCASERPGVRRLFDQTGLTIGEAESAQRALASSGLEHQVRQIQVRPDAPRSERLLQELASSLTSWFQLAERLDDQDLEDIDGRGGQLYPLLQYQDRPPRNADEVNRLLTDLRRFRQAVQKSPWGER